MAGKLNNAKRGIYADPMFKYKFKKWLWDNRFSMRSFCKEKLTKIDHSFMSKVLHRHRPIPYLLARKLYYLSKGELSYGDIYGEENLSSLGLDRR